MWYRSDYEDLFEFHQEVAEDYTDENSNSELAQTFFVAANNLHDFRERAIRMYGEVVGDRHKMQLIYLHRGVDALFSLFWLVRHYQYTAAYGRVRFLLETYLVVRDFNQNKERSGKKWREKLNDYKTNDYGQYEADPLTKYFDGRRRDLLGQFNQQYDWFDEMMGQLSDKGAHPQSIQSMYNDSKVSETIERDLFQFGSIFNFALAAQYIRVFDDTSIAQPIREELDPIFVQTMLVCPELPVFLEEDLEFGSMRS